MRQFTKGTGLKDKCAEGVDGNDSYYGKVQGPPAAGQGIDRDLIRLIDWMPGRLVHRGSTQELVDNPSIFPADADETTW